MNEHLIKYTAKELENLSKKYSLRFNYEWARLYIQAIGLFRPMAWKKELGTGSWNSFVNFNKIYEDGQEKFYITQYDKPELQTDHLDPSYRHLGDSYISGSFASKEDFYVYLEDFVKKIGELRIAHLEQQRLKFLQEDF